LKLNSSSLHACLISDCWNLVMVDRRNPGGTRIRNIWPPKYCRRYPATVVGCLRTSRNWPESDRIRPLIRPNLAKMAGIWSDLDGSATDPPGSGWIWRSLAGSCQTCSPESGKATGRCPIPAIVAFSHFVIFFVQTKCRKIFSRIFFKKNNFVENILRRKLFYVETNGA
jgi:hypothetical protein